MMTLEDAHKICSVIGDFLPDSDMDPDDWVRLMNTEFPEFKWAVQWPLRLSLRCVELPTFIVKEDDE